MKLYVAYSATDNGANADFKVVSSDHGDEVGCPAMGITQALFPLVLNTRSRER